MDDPNDWVVNDANDSSNDEEDSFEEQLPEQEAALSELEFDRLKETVQLAQKDIFIEEVDDLTCPKCGSRTYLPPEYAEQNPEEEIICNDCMITKSGHENCDAPTCSVCEDIAGLIQDRLNVSQQFMNGTLAVLSLSGLNISADFSPRKGRKQGCHSCGCSSNLLHLKNKKYSCNECLIELSGHKDCVIPTCSVCMEIALQIKRKMNCDGSGLNKSIQLIPKKRNPNIERMNQSCFSAPPTKLKKKKTKSKSNCDEDDEFLVVSSPDSSFNTTPTKKRFTLCKRN